MNLLRPCVTHVCLTTPLHCTSIAHLVLMHAAVYVLRGHAPSLLQPDRVSHHPHVLQDNEFTGDLPTSKQWQVLHILRLQVGHHAACDLLNLDPTGLQLQPLSASFAPTLM